ncbi:MAG: hypothetical protein ACRD4D_03785 [Candidatus Acidiferrales bacterium]
MKHRAAVLITLAGLLLLPVGLAPAPPSAEAFDPAWAADALWDDGQAEVALYQARRPQYGKIESYEAVFIVVKEDFNPRLNVKADPPYEGKQLLPVLKLNAAHSYWTDNYPYHYLLSVFVRRADPGSLVKLTLGSQEWCGNTFKQVSAAGGRAELHFHSYFDPEGDAARPLDLRPGDLLEDQLPLVLRGLRFAPGLAFTRRLLPSLISNNLRAPIEIRPALFKVEGEEKISTPAGAFAAWKVRVTAGELEQTWWFEKAAPHTLLKMESSDGRAWLLKARTRKPYWQSPTFKPAM